ncbi:MAG: methyltransferase [Proteobacteria bacterium]|nr:MAG: methyltransferase [Pseudomonadota bacterium]
MNSLSLYQYKNAYRYNSDTLFLYDFIRHFIFGSKPLKVLDVGAGCGILGLLLKRDLPSLEVELLDFQAQNISLCEENAILNNLHVKIKKIDFLEFRSDVKYDVIISNPPFYDGNSKKSENKHLAKSRYNDFLPLESFAKKAYGVLENKGNFYFCYGSSQLPMVLDALVSVGFGVETLRFVHGKKEREASLVLVRAVKNSKSICKILPPLFTSDDEGYSLEAKKVFARANTISLKWEK